MKSVISEKELIERIRRFKITANATLYGSPFYRPEFNIKINEEEYKDSK